MLVLDTDHLTEYQSGRSAEAQRLKERLDAATQPYATTIITVEEIMRGWMASVRRTRDPHRQIHGYSMLRRLFQFFATWSVLEWDDAAVDQFESLRDAKIRVGTMDLKIAAICMANHATLLTRNAVDFNRVPGLPIEDWLS
jgi:tRNA(fMet)-specific endonuclease VapC